MSIFEYDKEEEEKKLRKAEYEAGVSTGMKVGMKAGIEKGERKKAKEAVIAFSAMGIPLEKIADALKLDEALVRQWAEK